MQRGPNLSQSYRIGQFFWAPSLFLFGERQPYLLRSDYIESRRDYHYRVEPFRQSEFNSPGTINHTLRIRPDERPLIIGAKRRPVIIISRDASMWTDSHRKQEDCFLVAPVYSFGGNEAKLPYSRNFIERVKAYEYWQFFYLPALTTARIREGFVSFDRIQAVHKSLLQHIPLMLSDDIQGLLQSWIRVYLGEELSDVDSLLAAYRTQAIANLP